MMSNDAEELSCGGNEEPVSVVRFPEWQKPCECAFLEPDPEKLFHRVIVAETAIFRRRHKLTSTLGNVELQAMDEALKTLRRLLAHTFTIPISEETPTGSPLRLANSSQLRPNRVKQETQPVG
jgi:hypothetical protein